mmetsp:Transcript_9626/g.12716  ORF Transcript_9626/g.12716 Transcript_9626/m.12716 type:complete len:190 (-) Transcript_9626:185-754(-)|eukprot:CAMPEP_0198143200 /NCGR_PEP_ID=MMETSP1443-20131203/6025_1 /TAXON_ID=186043 /ORGANISM="Entomoneis sp., Strain CCMP2396" /LENGTH=189 /DNA_ID=CAMNT_0043806387 /DNA_START=65 /DNA_END=634 /DNA_ORIENTATION=-
MKFLLVLTAYIFAAEAFSVPSTKLSRRAFVGRSVLFVEESSNVPSTTVEALTDPMEEAVIDDVTRQQMEKQKRADELRAQEVFMKKSTGKHQCTNCDWEFDETKGDSMMIGGMIKPDTPFSELPSNWRCPVCRASKDSFVEIVEEIPGFEVNQGYGFGTNGWTAEQKNGAIFGGLAAFFLLFISGYALN